MNTPRISANKFAEYAKNNYSQFGEDGIIEEILKLIPNKNNWCVEFGAWDGIHLSNTYSLIKNNNYKSVLIEADKKKFRVLEDNLKKLDAILVNEFVMFSGKNTLDNILSNTPIPQDFDFLSIDIDGNDYYILESLDLYKPKLVCIEYNPTIPNEVSYVQPKDFNIHRGASALAILNLAESKGYSLAATTMCNLILVDTAYLPLLKLQGSALSEFRDDESSKVFIFAGYDGSVCMSKPLELPWHNIKVSEDGLQVLPKVIRRFRDEYTIVQKILYTLFSRIKFPSNFQKNK
jgi:hypothetical protein